LLTLLAGVLAAGENVVEPDEPAVAMAEQGCHCKKKTLFRDLDAKEPRTPPKCLLFHVMFVLSCKIHNKS
jgi:hypothetical protein